MKKKTELKHSTPKSFNAVLCIPGNWNNIDEIKNSIFISSGGEYAVAGNTLTNNNNGRQYNMEFYDRDERMKKAFEIAGMATRVTENFLNEIDTHNFVIYVSGTAGSLKEAEHIAFAGFAILKAGGLGIKIETAAKAFEKHYWCELIENFEPSDLYEMFVIDSIVDDHGTVYSCGMQNLGFKDTIISGQEFQKAVDLISLFGYYQIIDEPTIKNNQTFSKGAESPIFRITDEVNQPYKGEDLLENPFGMWRMTEQ